MSGDIREIRPQLGLQEAFLSTPADIAIAGGAAGAGKTWALLLEPIRHESNPNFGAVVFRRTYPQITNEGGLWDEAMRLYPLRGARANQNELYFRFPSGMSVSFAHLQHLKDAYSWSGAQVPLLLFDQLEEFAEKQFWFMLSRNRSATAGVRPYVRGTVNPVPDDDPVGGWVNQFLAWWWDPETGYPIPERAGVIRWFVRHEEKITWADTAGELTARFGPESLPKSATFIPGTLDDNQILDKANPEYRANLNALPRVERERLLRGNWLIKATAGEIFDRAWFRALLRAIPTDVEAWVRYWDKAGTKGGGKYSAGVLMGRRPGGRYLIADITRGQWSALERENVIQQKAELDKQRFGNVSIWVEQEPGSGGKESAENTVRNLAGHVIHSERVTGDKVTRAGPLSAQAEAGNIDLLLAEWNEDFLREAQNFDGVHGFTDQVDAASGAFNKASSAPPAFAAAVSAPPTRAGAKGGLRGNYAVRSRS